LLNFFINQIDAPSGNSFIYLESKN